MSARVTSIEEGPFVLMVLLSHCCPNIASSTISPTFKGLECTCGKNCSYGVQDCQLIRCVCPYDPGNYTSGLNCSGSLCPENCCDLIPQGLRDHSATHFMFSENHHNYNESENVRTIQIFTKLKGSATARWMKTGVQQLPNLSFIYSAEAASFSTFADKLANGMTDFLDNEAEAPDGVFGVTLQSIEDSKGFSETLQCHDGLNTTCDSEFCECLKFSENQSPPVDNPLRHITGGNIVLDIGNDNATVGTSSSLTPYHSIDVTRRSSDTLGGWAPFFNDSSPWVEFSDIQADVCGVVIQGAAWSSSRRLDKFKVVLADGRIVETLKGQNFFLSGLVLDSKSTHLFSKPEIKPTSLRINVLEPDNRLNVGFRASLITCGEAPMNSFEDTCEEPPLLQITQEIVEDILNTSSQGPNLGKGQDQVDLVGNIYNTLKTFLDENLKDKEFPEGSRFTVTEKNTEIDVYFVNRKDLNKTGYTFDSSETDNKSDNSHATRVYIPPEGFALDVVNTEVVIVTSVVDGNKESLPGESVTEDEKLTDEHGYQYSFSSPIVTVTVFANDTRYEDLQIIGAITVQIPYKNTTTNPRALYFQEKMVAKSNGVNIQWSSRGCDSSCHEFVCEMNCSHATSFAVLQLLGQSKLSGGASSISSIVTTIGCVVSIISLVAALLIYLFVRSSISSAQYAIHSNLMISLLIALCIFMTLLIKEKSEMMCECMKFLLQYSFSAAFCWMLCEGIHLYRQIITVFESGKKYIWVYFLIGWALPILFVVTSFVGIKVQNVEKPLSSNSTCFFSYSDGSIWYFVAPILVVVLINTGILVRIILIVIRAAKAQAQKDSSEFVCQAKAGLRSALLLIPLLGCSYILGFLVSFHGAIEFTYNVINSLQGFFIAMFYCVMNKEIRTAILKYIQRSRDMSTIQASTTGTAYPKSASEKTSKNTSMSTSRNQVAPEPAETDRLEKVD